MTFGTAFLAALLRGIWLRARRASPFSAAAPVGLAACAGGFLIICSVSPPRHAPAVDASLICFLWPLLIVLLSSLLPGERLTLVHVVGAAMGFAGAALIPLERAGWSFQFEAQYWLGYLAAGACALTWSGYSVLSRRVGDVPTDAVGGFCGATALLG
jgi:drug/metabolite transporter (DMT)-like permease